jgi:molybdopterin biosynthesis enzyme
VPPTTGPAGEYFGQALAISGAAVTLPLPEAARLPRRRATLSRDLASATGRVATPLFGASALLSVLTAADGYIVIPEEATGLDAGTEVTVTLYT